MILILCIKILAAQCCHFASVQGLKVFIGSHVSSNEYPETEVKET